MAAPRDRKTEHYEERTTSTIIPATGPIDRSQFSDIIEPVDMMTVNDKIKNLAFMEEPVDVIINESDNPNAEQTIQLLCNGVSQFMIRGQMQTIKRKFLAILATAKSDLITTPEVTDSTGAKTTKIVHTLANKYPFSVIYDPNPNGREWLRQLMRNS